MILDKLGVLSTAQDLTNGSTASENQIKMSARDWSQITDAWLAVDCETAAGGDTGDTFKFELRVATSTALTTHKQVCCVDITSNADRRLATAGKPIAGMNIGKSLKSACQALIDAQSLVDTDFIYAGLYTTISAVGTISINAALSPHEPPTEDHRQVVDSNVGIPDKCSAAS